MDGKAADTRCETFVPSPATSSWSLVRAASRQCSGSRRSLPPLTLCASACAEKQFDSQWRRNPTALGSSDGAKGLPLASAQSSTRASVSSLGGGPPQASRGPSEGEPLQHPIRYHTCPPLSAGERGNQGWEGEAAWLAGMTSTSSSSLKPAIEMLKEHDLFQAQAHECGENDDPGPEPEAAPEQV